MESARHEAGVLDQWSARKIQPRVVAYVGVVFAAFIALAHFLFQSPAGVSALAAAATAAIVQLLLGVANRVEYRLTEAGLAKRPIKEKEPAAFESVFRWDELSYVVPMKHGFKYFKTFEGSNPVRRFWKAHLSEASSGEVHLETKDRNRIVELLARRGVPLSKPETGRSLLGGR